MPRLLHVVVRCALLALAAALALPAADAIFFSRDFPGSGPPYFDVTVERTGKAVYREALDDEFPVEFEVQGAELERVFELAESLDRFRTEIASSRKTAFTGNKIFRYAADGGETTEAKFVYTENATANELLGWFNKVGETERHIIELERVVQFDRLGVNKALLQFQISYDKGRVVAPEQFLPILTKITEQQKIIHLARARAASLIERITGLTD